MINKIFIFEISTIVMATLNYSEVRRWQLK